MLTDKQYKSFEPYEKQLRQAYYHNYYTQIPRAALEMMHEEYKKASGDVQKVNFGCGACVLGLLKKVGKLYFEYEPTPTTIPVEETFVKDEDIEKKQTIWDRMAKARAAKKNKK